MGCNSSKSNGQKNKKQNSKNEKDLITFNNFIRENKNDPRQDYRFGKRLGEGTYGMVVKVQHIQTKETRAMKKIPKSGLSTTEQKLRLVNDIEIIRELSHPNIIKVYEFYQDAESFYVATEYCRGGELFSRIADDKVDLSEMEAANVIKQCLEVLQYCKKQKIAHRDLKPDNIMIDTADVESGNYEVKIIDWGCSKKYNDNPIMHDLVGTPYYIAPEVINKKYDYKCDIWSLGVILFALLCGEPCFTGNSAEEVMDKIKKGKFEYEQPIWTKISDDAKDLINKMLTYKPENRIDCSEALQHPWLKNAPKQKLDPNLMKQTKEKMKNFKCQNQLGYAVLSYISSQLIAKDSKANIIKAFKELDKNGDGTLTKDEILEYYRKTMTEEAAQEEVDELMKRADQNQNDQINYEEFVVAVMDQQQIQNEQKIKQAFEYFDQDGNGTITAEELKNVLGSPGMEKQQIEYWQNVIKESDKDGDKKINFEEFKQMISKQFG